jgi:hypothetical protein
MIKAIIAFLAAIPEIIKLIEAMQKAHEEAQVKEDLKKITKAFEDKDANALSSIFNS